jgi:tetratricopeptide (TPR) repeat protein
MTSGNALYDQILRQGASAETFRILLSELKRDGDSSKMLQECIRAVRLYPQDPFLRRLLAESYLETGFMTQAEMELEKLASQIVELVPVYKILAEIYRKQRRGEDAVRALRTYLAHRPEDHEALDAFEAMQSYHAITEETAAAQLRGPGAVEIDESAGEEEAESPEEAAASEIATPTLAEVYVNQGDIDEALSIYRRIIARNPQDERSAQRVKELEALLTGQPPVPEEKIDRGRKNKERAIAILEAWLTDIRRMYHDSANA